LKGWSWGRWTSRRERWGGLELTKEQVGRRKHTQKKVEEKTPGGGGEKAG